MYILSTFYDGLARFDHVMLLSWSRCAIPIMLSYHHCTKYELYILPHPGLLLSANVGVHVAVTMV